MILVTNDDGIHAEGIQTLAESLSGLDEVCVVAPDQERSAISMAITLKRPVGVKRYGTGSYTTDGTPVDCVNVAFGTLLDSPPSLLVSGINHGANLGHDVHYSGTLAAAIQGTFLGIPSFAVSLVSREGRHFETAAAIAVHVAKVVLENGLPQGVLLNVNVPDVPQRKLGNIVITRQDLGAYDAQAVEDAETPMHFWIAGERQPPEDCTGTDMEAIRRRQVSVTPIQLDMTNHLESIHAYH